MGLTTYFFRMHTGLTMYFLSSKYPGFLVTKNSQNIPSTGMNGDGRESMDGKSQGDNDENPPKNT
jgi:hypothetical protein